MSYDLKINVKKGTVVGGGLANNAYVEVWIDGMLVETTASVPSPPEWNKEVIKEFDTLEPAIPVVISFIMHKKRWTSDGYKVVGSAQFLLSDLADKLNKGPFTKNLSLIASKKNITLSGTIQILLELTGGPPAEEDDGLSPEDKLKKRSSRRILNNGGALKKILSALIPIPKENFKPEELGFVSQTYRYLFHFENQTFGRVVKILVLVIWLVIIKYSMDMWMNMHEKTRQIEGSLGNIYNLFEQLK